MIVAPADAHRILLRRAQPRDGLAGVEQPASRAFDPLDIGMGGRRGARQQLQEVERGAFAGQQCPGRPLDLKQHLIRLDRGPLARVPIDLNPPSRRAKTAST